jgi:hypothetical protein
VNALAGDTFCGGSCDGTVPPALDWVIVGGESGPGSRPCDVAWVRSIVRQCKDAAVPVFVKQLGAVVTDSDAEEWLQDVGWPAGTNYIPEGKPGGPRVLLRDRKGGDMDEWPEDLRVREFPA